MDQRFTSRAFLPGVWHIMDAMGVCMTLLIGNNCALLVDTGYGTADVAAYVATLTDKPLTVLLTHAHHDHALGARWFAQTFMFAEDSAAFSIYTGEKQRRSVAAQAEAKGIPLPEDFLTAPIPAPLPLKEGDIPLGGLTACVLHVPGHTPGSAVVYVPELSLLLTGDDWNPCTWLFFPEALPAADYRRHMSALLDLPFKHVLCSHRMALYQRSMLEDFITALTDETLRAAPAVRIGHPQNTHQATLPHDQVFVFDWDRFITHKE